MKFLIKMVLILSITASCVPIKRLTYLQENGSTNEGKYEFKLNNYRIQPNDILNITVKTFDRETNSIFNATDQQQNNALQAGDIIFYIQGYSVDLNGNIDFPVVGKINVQNLTTEEVKMLIVSALSEFFESEAFSVSVQLTGIRFTVVGEVNAPGKYIIYQNQANVFEALAMSGDVSIVGDRKEVMIIRQIDGKSETIYLDLTNAELLSDPAYFIMPNDIINVKPLRQKSYGTGTQGIQTFTQIFSLVASTITLIIAINSLNQ